jgi:hypothetical protein
METPAISGWMAAEIAVEALRLALEKVGYENLTGENVKKYGLEAIKDFEGLLHPKTSLSATQQQTGTLLRVYKATAGKPLWCGTGILGPSCPGIRRPGL